MDIMVSAYCMGISASKYCMGILLSIQVYCMGILVSAYWQFYSLLFSYFVRTRTRILDVLCDVRVRVSASTYPRQVMSTLRKKDRIPHYAWLKLMRVLMRAKSLVCQAMIGRVVM